MSISNLLNALIVGVVILLVIGRCVLLFSLWPSFSTRVSPWLRQRAWWPVPAERRAEALLRDMLTEAEYRQVCTTGYLDVVSPSHSGRIYRVPRGPEQGARARRRARHRAALRAAGSGRPRSLRRTSC